MKRQRTYERVIFDVQTFEGAFEQIQKIVIDTTKTSWSDLEISRGSDTWNYDTPEEFHTEYRAGFEVAGFILSNYESGIRLRVDVSFWEHSINTRVLISSNDRDSIHRIGHEFEKAIERCRVPQEEKQKKPIEKPKIFIGHGGSLLWRDLKDHLQDHHGYQIVAYETGSRAGHSIRDIVSEMLENSAFAILVMTGEDEQPDGSFRARQNVVHEIGLFQGRLGFSKAIVLLERGTDEFSNIYGVQQIRFGKGAIRETFGDVLAVLVREFPKGS
jgi:predicted nucleotide-binding protein